MSKTIALAQYSEKWIKTTIVALLCSLLLLGVVYFLQTGDLIKKTFVLGSYQVKMASIERQLAATIANDNNLLSLNQIEVLATDSGFVPVGQVQYIPLTASLTASANQLVVSNIR
ncbi:MAG: hypothetical protein NTZ42_02945 [Candidatus Gribaldobacteria bacterium]|nr:hypothetical protein [Candidatus Gribaldobacteria bacterium]